jgi:cytochrome b subunit of formate dehydrogenase
VAGPSLERNSRPTRLLHGTVAVTTLGAGLSGIALWGEEGVRAVADLFGGHAASARWHRWLGYAVPVTPLAALLVRPRAVLRFLRECGRFDRADLGWWRRFPLFVASPGRWPLTRHNGHFDPGQRLMAWGLIASLAVLTVSGLLMILAVDWLGPRYGIALRTHTWASVVLGALVAAHVLVSAGVLKGYRGVWRAMHAPARGRVPAHVAERLWPAWVERERGHEVARDDRADDQSP